MFDIPVLLGSIRRNRESLKVARFAVRWLSQLPCVETELLDLKEIDLPMMEERLRFRQDSPASVIQFSARIRRADSIVIVSPEYSGCYPGVLKNALDYLKDEYRRKPFGFITVSAAETGGVLCMAALRQLICQLGGVPVPTGLSVANVRQAFDADGNPTDSSFHKRAQVFFDEVLWFTEALTEQRRKTVIGN
jgi:NAD(P)H-dependent FMN reductase